MTKPKVAFYWCASCGGCEEAVVDLDEALLDVAAAVEIVLWPVALDFKYTDVEALPDGSIAAAFINGAIRTAEQEHIAKLLRRKAQAVVAFGSCSSAGGIPALANLTSKEAIFDRSYHHSPSVVNPEGTEPQQTSTVDGHELTLPEFYSTVYKLADVIQVDYTLPGCAPPPKLIAAAVTALLEGTLPTPGAVLAPNQSLCKSCARNATKPENLELTEFKRVTEVALDPQTCFLAQGVVCMGPATRDGCGETCISGNMPCTGCMGPTDNCRDQGAKMISVLGGLLAGDDPAALEQTLDGLVDPAGTFYRYGLSASLVGSARKEDD